MRDQDAMLVILSAFPGSTILNETQIEALATRSEEFEALAKWRDHNSGLPEHDLNSIKEMRGPTPRNRGGRAAA